VLEVFEFASGVVEDIAVGVDCTQERFSIKEHLDSRFFGGVEAEGDLVESLSVD
jgi:hypothetical protein